MSDKPTATPGPWKIREWQASETPIVERASSGREICIVNRDADAHLIAAAPDLLNACNAALDFIMAVGRSSKLPDGITPNAMYATLNKLFTAIAKTKGGEQ